MILLICAVVFIQLSFYLLLECHIDFCSELCFSCWLAVRQSVRLTWQKLLMLDITHKLSYQFFHTWHACRHLWLMPFCTTFIGGNLVLAFRLQGQCKARPLGLISFTHFSTDQDEIWCVLKQLKQDIPALVLSEIYWNKGNHCCFTDLVRKL